MNSGAGKALAVTYGVFALAAGARSAVQIATRFDEAPLPYLLSALAAAVYLVIAVTIARPSRRARRIATLACARPSRRARRIATLACATELCGVLAVGLASVLDPGTFADQTVWSRFGEGYGFLPVALPILGLIWLRRSARAPGPGERRTAGGEPEPTDHQARDCEPVG